jgi:hypothetical protein
MTHSFLTFVRECQIFVGQSALGTDARNRRRFVRDFISRLPQPQEPFERIIFRAILFEIALRWSTGS